MEIYKTQDFSSLKGMSGFSDKALDIHFGICEGYVNNTNKLLSMFSDSREAGESATSEYAELKRRFGWEFDGMRLHEFYFAALGGDGKINKECELIRAMEENFGSYEEWREDFIATASMRGIGWAILYYDPENGKLINFWINEHNEGHPAGMELLLNVDVFEHAFLLDYGTNRAGYLEAFMKNLDWKEVEKRFKDR